MQVSLDGPQSCSKQDCWQVYSARGSQGGWGFSALPLHFVCAFAPIVSTWHFCPRSCEYGTRAQCAQGHVQARRNLHHSITPLVDGNIYQPLIACRLPCTTYRTEGTYNTPRSRQITRSNPPHQLGSCASTTSAEVSSAEGYSYSSSCSLGLGGKTAGQEHIVGDRVAYAETLVHE